MTPPHPPLAFARALRIALLAVALAGGAHAQSGKVDITVTQQGRTFVVAATLEAPVPAALAWEVLTDFEQMDHFVPNLTDSRILARDGNRLTIAQRGIARFGPLAISFASEREVTLEPPRRIRSVQTRGSMEKLESVTTFVATAEGTRLDYRVEVIPGALYPDVVARRFLRHEVSEQFDAIVREMLRRRPSPG